MVGHIAQYKAERVNPYARAFYDSNEGDVTAREATGKQYIAALDEFLAYLYELTNVPGSGPSKPTGTGSERDRGVEVQITWAEAEKIKVADLMRSESGKTRGTAS